MAALFSYFKFMLSKYDNLFGSEADLIQNKASIRGERERTISTWPIEQIDNAVSGLNMSATT